jgi:hypothetical protein
MDADDDAPPQLVDTNVQKWNEQPREIHNFKVPITLVTGEALFSSKQVGEDGGINVGRISRCREDDTAQLHLDRPAWQKDCRHHER